MSEKVATCRPDGKVRMSEDVFYDVSWEQKSAISLMKEGREKMEASLRFADYCCDSSEYDTAVDFYASVLQKCIGDGRILKKYKELADRAYHGLQVCNSSRAEYAWEMSSELLAGYRELFEKKEQP